MFAAPRPRSMNLGQPQWRWRTTRGLATIRPTRFAVHFWKFCIFDYCICSWLVDPLSALVTLNAVVLGSKQFKDRKRCRRFGSRPADPTRTRVAELESLDRGLQSTKVTDARLITFLSNIASDRALTIAGESHGHLKPCHVDASVAAPGPRDRAQAPPSRPRRQTSYPTPSPIRSHRLGNVR